MLRLAGVIEIIKVDNPVVDVQANIDSDYLTLFVFN